MLYLIKNNIKKEYVNIRSGICSISKDIIGGIGAILSLLTFVSAMICFLILLVKFISSGGYENVLSDVLLFRGNAGDFYNMPYFGILGSLNLALLLLSYISFFKKEIWGMRILGIVPFVVLFGCLIAYSVMEQMYEQGNFEVTDETRRLAYGLIIGRYVAMIISVIILLIREKVISRSCLRMLVLSFCVLPLLTFCIENIVILVICIVVLQLISVFARGLILEGGGDNYESSKKSTYEKPKKISGLTKEQQQAIHDINRRYKKGCAAIVKANNDNGAWLNSDNTNREILKLRQELEREAEQRGVKGKVSIY